MKLKKFAYLITLIAASLLSHVSLNATVRINNEEGTETVYANITQEDYFEFVYEDYSTSSTTTGAGWNTNEFQVEVPPGGRADYEDSSFSITVSDVSYYSYEYFSTTYS